MNICTDNFKNALTSSPYLFTLEYLFTLSYFYMFTHIAYEHIHLAPAAQADNC